LCGQTFIQWFAIFLINSSGKKRRTFFCILHYFVWKCFLLIGRKFFRRFTLLWIFRFGNKSKSVYSTRSCCNIFFSQEIRNVDFNLKLHKASWRNSKMNRKYEMSFNNFTLFVYFMNSFLSRTNWIKSLLFVRFCFSCWFITGVNFFFFDLTL
jgi:hypothetical protein